MLLEVFSMPLNWKVSLLGFWRYNRAILGVADPADAESAVPVSDAAPLPVRVVSSPSAAAPIASLTRTNLTLTAQAQALPAIPASATGARITVEAGDARIATAAPDPTATDGELWLEGSVWYVAGRADLLAFRAVAARSTPVLQITYTGAA